MTITAAAAIIANVISTDEKIITDSGFTKT